MGPSGPLFEQMLAFGALAVAGSVWASVRASTLAARGYTGEDLTGMTPAERKRHRKAWKDARNKARRRQKNRERNRYLGRLAARHRDGEDLTSEEVELAKTVTLPADKKQLSVDTIEALKASSSVVVVNCGYSHANEREERSLAYQLSRTYAHNRRLCKRACSRIVAWDCPPLVESQLLKDNADKWAGFTLVPCAEVDSMLAAWGSTPSSSSLARAEEGDGGDARRLLQCPEVARDPSKVLVLSPDSPNVLHSVKDDDVIVIGGIIDRTVSRATTLRTAEEAGLRHARLPVAEVLTSDAGLKLHENIVLNVDSAAKSIMSWRADGDWKAALDPFVPKRIRTKAQITPAELQ